MKTILYCLFSLIMYFSVVQLTPFDDLIIKWSYTAPYISYKKVTGYFLAQYLFTYDSYYKSICRIIVYVAVNFLFQLIFIFPLF